MVADLTPASDVETPAEGSAGLPSRLVKHTLIGHKDSVLCLAADPKARQLASGSADCMCRIWDVAASGKARCVRAAKLAGEATGVAFHPTEEHLLLVAVGCDVLGFDMRSDRIVLQEPAHHAAALAKEEINQVVVDPQGQLAAVADDSGEVHLLSFRTWARERSLAGRNRHSSMCSSVAFRPGRSWGVASGGMDAAVVLWQRTGKSRVARMQPDVQEDSATTTGGPQLLNPPFVHSVAYSPNGLTLAAGLGDGTVALLDADNGEQQQRLRGAHGAAVAKVLYAPPGLFSAGNDLGLCLWGSPKPTRLEHSEKVNDLAWAGGLLLVAGVGKDIIAYEGFGSA